MLTLETPSKTQYAVYAKYVFPKRNVTITVINNSTHDLKIS